jgi:hypothetical protein
MVSAIVAELEIEVMLEIVAAVSHDGVVYQKDLGPILFSLPAQSTATIRTSPGLLCLTNKLLTLWLRNLLLPKPTLVTPMPARELLENSNTWW